MKVLLVLILFCFSVPSSAKGLTTHLIAGGVGYAVGKSSSTSKLAPNIPAIISDALPIYCHIWVPGVCDGGYISGDFKEPIVSSCQKVYGIDYVLSGYQNIADENIILMCRKVKV